jgi:putative aldouronate transport system permease protein
MKRSPGEKIFNVCNIIFMGLVALICVYPFLYVFSMSLSSAAEASRGGFHLYPRGINFSSYRLVLSDPAILTGYYNTILRTVLGTFLTVVATCVAAYPLSRKEMPLRSMIIFFILFTMLFGGGIVPNYILVNRLGLTNTIWALILPILLSPFNILIVKNFFQSIPESFSESARLDGASELRILFNIYMPLSKPVIATISLWTMVTHWNQWFDAMLYITDDKKQVLQTFLQRIVIENSQVMTDLGLSQIAVTDFTPETIKAATIIVTILPIICVYPFVQKYFVKGIMLGGIKE